jgi:protein involved in polysaccharide export with SLBB domain
MRNTFDRISIVRPRALFDRAVASIVIFALLAAGSGCTRFKAPPTYPVDDPAYQPGGVSRDGLVSDPPVPLVILPGDTLTLRTMSSETHEYEGLVVDGEGKVHVPISGPVVVAGLAPAQAERKIEEVLQKLDRFVRVSVIITGWGGHTATVIGAVVTEGQKQLSPGMRLAELMAVSGGPLRTGGSESTGGEISYAADLESARLVRNGSALPVSVRLALAGDARHNVLVHPGDQLFVPAGLGSRIAVLGQTGTHGVMLNYRPGMRVTEALASAGGFTIDSDDEDIRVIRGPLDKPIVYQYDFDALYSGKGGDIELAPGDVVYVTDHWVANVGEVINRLAPLLSVMITGLNTYLVIKTLENENNNN